MKNMIARERAIEVTSDNGSSGGISRRKMIATSTAAAGAAVLSAARMPAAAACPGDMCPRVNLTPGANPPSLPVPLRAESAAKYKLAGATLKMEGPIPRNQRR